MNGKLSEGKGKPFSEVGVWTRGESRIGDSNPVLVMETGLVNWSQFGSRSELLEWESQISSFKCCAGGSEWLYLFQSFNRKLPDGTDGTLFRLRNNT